MSFDLFSPYSPRDINFFFKKQGAIIRKNWGQNFLIDPNTSLKITEHISKLLAQNGSNSVIEVGPGFGVLTQNLLQKQINVYAIEIDPVLVNFLNKRKWQDKNRPRLLLADILSFLKVIKEKKSFSDKLDGNQAKQVILEKQKAITIKLKKDSLQVDRKTIRFVCGNLPYYISTDFFVLLMDLTVITSGVFLIQKEYAERILNNSKVNSIGIYLHNYGTWKKCMTVKYNVFYPAPKIDSILISYQRHPEGPCSPPLVLEKLLRLCFNGRRKKLLTNWKRNLSSLFPEIQLEEFIELAKASQIEPECRAEQLERTHFYSLASKLSSKQN